MAMDQASRRCRTCKRMTLHVRSRMSEGWGCLFTILTLGLFLPIWLLMSVFGTFSSYRCQSCGRAN